MPAAPTQEIKAIVDDPDSPITSVTEAKKVQERVAIGAKVVYEAVRLEGEEELERPAIALAWSGLAAGLSMGFSLLAESALNFRGGPIQRCPYRQVWIGLVGALLGLLVNARLRQHVISQEFGHGIRLLLSATGAKRH